MNKVQAYAQWYKGQKDRLQGKQCNFANGQHYLDGWYSPFATIPDFLTQEQAANIRRDHEQLFRLA